MSDPESPTSARYPEMAYMLGYFHGNWIDDPRYIDDGEPDQDRVIGRFLAIEHPATIVAARNELRAYLQDEHSEAELKQMLSDIYASIRPAAFGMTVRQWLEHVRDLLVENA